MATRKRKLGKAAFFKLDEKGIERAIFRGAKVSEHRGFSDAFTDDAILSFFDHPKYNEFSPSFRSWAYYAIEAADERARIKGKKQTARKNPAKKRPASKKRPAAKKRAARKNPTRKRSAAPKRQRVKTLNVKAEPDTAYIQEVEGLGYVVRFRYQGGNIRTINRIYPDMVRATNAARDMNFERGFVLLKKEKLVP